MELTGMTNKRPGTKRSVKRPFRALFADQLSPHGGNIYRAAGELGMPESSLVDFSASINPLGIPGKVRQAIAGAYHGLVNYPDPDTKVLRNTLARHHSIDPDTILCGNGSTELIYLIPRALHPAWTLIPAPTFSEYERAVTLSERSGSGGKGSGRAIRIEYLHLKKTDGYRISPEKFISAMRSSLSSSPSSGMAFLCNPNNPTGGLLSRNEVLGIAAAAAKKRNVLVVDEAFIDYCPEHSVLHDVQDNPYLIVLRSMTKFYALTGLRIGYGVFHKDILPDILKYKEPWTVNNLAQQAAVTAIGEVSYQRRTIALMKREKEFLEKGFRTLGLEFFPSAANYYLLNIGKHPVVSLLREKGILIRDCSNFRGLGSPYIRVAVKSRRHNRMLLEEIGKCLML